MNKKINRYSYDEIRVGQSEVFEVTVTSEMLDKFCEISGDINPLHNDAQFARTRNYPDRVCFGMMTASFLSTLAGVYLPGEKSLIHSVKVEFPNPVIVGDLITICGVVKEKNDTFKTITLKITVRNQSGKKVCRGEMRIGMTD